MSDQSVRISHQSEVNVKTVQTKGSYDLSKGKLVNFLEESSAPVVASFTLVFENASSFNYISYNSLEKMEEFLPDTFRIEISDDGVIWESIIKEYDYTRSGKKSCHWSFPMITAKYLKLVSKMSRKDKNGNYKISLANFKLAIQGVEKIQASSENDRLWVKENIFDERNDYGWSSKERTTPSEEFLLLDLGSINRVDEFRILSKDSDETFFPEQFLFYYSEDDLTWQLLHEEPNFIAEPGTWYKWKFFPTNMRYFKLVMANNKINSAKKYACQIIELEIFAAPDYLSLSKKKIINETPPYSSAIRSGLVRLAQDGETNPSVAVQGNDRRLRDATTEFKGIVELATDGEERPLVAVQGNDSRLKKATENTFGLVRLAKNGENRSETVVQGNDDRLKPATVSNMGIVELAEDGETRPNTAVQGNDSRLKKATVKDYGLVMLAELGEDTPGKVVTGDDPRFKNATTEKEGILRFASNGESAGFAAVQGNDKRLKKATTESLGIVELAHDGETKDNTVVQGSDSRLKPASVTNAGIMQFADYSVKVPLKAVQADDPRLYDDRDPKPHSHDYADKIHTYDSHTGLIHITGETGSGIKNIVPPVQNQSVIFGKNSGKNGSGISGIGTDEGVSGYGEDFGVLGMSNSIHDDSAGIAGFGKKGYGGIFISQKNYAVYANGEGMKRRDMHSSGKAVLAKGDSDFFGKVRVINEKGDDCIARFFKCISGDIIRKGDIVSIGEREQTVVISKSSYSTRVLGVCTESSSLEFGEQKTGNDFYLIAVYGIVRINVDASEGGAIQPGDLLVSSLTGGYACKGDVNRIKPGMLIGKALAEWKKDKGSIPVLLCIG
ncbi:MAG TPA: discoidin domain-containing protein [Leptospiraceae bacterium]|nr:discoidin domain-containing protein [Leptospiraceae bacterium]HMY65268.1 discoidin domain-containing protein [Leptospiraceae bacterium]HNF12047.1 discoidin domain-containing protein [Leptospiraceae bacterium]HNI95180.1 discoidin domain-containing protein [Leptospiraceae bacterium]HNN02718.1 discoidin domain-containing protein [Leptospiraceae bacterium]